MSLDFEAIPYSAYGTDKLNLAGCLRLRLILRQGDKRTTDAFEVASFYPLIFLIC